MTSRSFNTGQRKFAAERVGCSKLSRLWLCCGWLALAATAKATDPVLQLLLPPGLAESQLRHINQAGSAVGHCEIFDAAGGTIADFSCIFCEGSLTPIPNLPSYRKLDCAAISDTGIAVGHAYSPQRKGDSALQAIFFNPRSNITAALPHLPATDTALATAISADGKMIAGVCSGQVCCWELNANAWEVVPLPQSTPGFSTQHVCLSDSGKIAVACQRDANRAQLLQWSCDNQGTWQTTVRLESEVTPHDVNNLGVVVGSKIVKAEQAAETRGFVLSMDAKLELIEPLEGDNFSTARAINNQGIVVGWSDAVGDETKWPKSFLWQDGHTRKLMIENMDSTPHQAYGINDRAEVAGLLERDNDPHAVGFIAEPDIYFPQHPMSSKPRPKKVLPK